MTRPGELERLTEITELLWLVKSRELRAKIEEEAELRRKMKDLEEQRRLCLDNLGSSEAEQSSPHLVAARWLRWSETERKDLNLDLAGTRAELIDLRSKAQTAFGRKIAAQQLSRMRK